MQIQIIGLLIALLLVTSLILTLLWTFGYFSDANRVQRAINKLPEEGGKIYIKPGMYIIDKTIEVK